jgi:nicotinate-nucleotide pyrophosphorylase (carboxylating)
MALREDIGGGDLTTKWTIGPSETASASIRYKESAVVAGLDVAARVWKILDKKIEVETNVKDGHRVRKGSTVARVSGSLRTILTGERTALNFLQRLSGIATITARYVDRVKGTRAKILDTRKTVPGFRMLDKYAVRVGGGENHRFGLFDMILIKENHLPPSGSVVEALEKVNRKNIVHLPVEVEVKNLDEFECVLNLHVDRILLDNMRVSEMRKAVKLAESIRRKRNRPLLEASGNVSLDNVRRIAGTGVDFISVGALTHSPRAVDITLLVDRSA